jgi:hypothetical protein
MKKCCFAAVCAVLVAAVLGAQEGGGVSFSADYVVKNYAGVRMENGTARGATRYTDDISIEDEELFGGLDGGMAINKPHELIAATAVLNIKDVAPADALKLYAEIAMEGSVNSFLGVTGTTHGQVLERLKAKYHFTNTEINAAIGAVVAGVVDAALEKRNPETVPTSNTGRVINTLVKTSFTNFFLTPSQANFNKLQKIEQVFSDNYLVDVWRTGRGAKQSIAVSQELGWTSSAASARELARTSETKVTGWLRELGVTYSDDIDCQMVWDAFYYSLEPLHTELAKRIRGY